MQIEIQGLKNKVSKTQGLEEYLTLKLKSLDLLPMPHLT